MATSSNDSWLLSLNVEELRVKRKERCENARRHHPPVFRVPTYVRKLRPQCYDVDFLPLGLYNRDFRNQTPIDELKLEVLSVFLEHLELDQQDLVWNTFCREIATPPPDREGPDLEHFYADDVGHSFMTPELARSALTLDAFFVVAFCIWQFQRYWNRFPLFQDPPLLVTHMMEIFSRGILIASRLELVNDIFWLCENQIPLFLVENVWNKVASHVPEEGKTSGCLEFGMLLEINMLIVLEKTDAGLPFQLQATREEIADLKSSDHLLQCLHRILCPDGIPPLLMNEGESFNSICMWTWKLPFMQQLLNFATQVTSALSRLRRLLVCNRTEHEPVPCRVTVPPASELRKAGIGFRGIQTNVGDLRFHKSFHHLTATVYLPRITVFDSSEKILRNLCLYESMKGQRTHRGIIPYSFLMEQLISTEEDVRLLMEGDEPVIAGNTLADDKMALNLFTCLTQHVNGSSSDWDHQEAVKCQIITWYNQRWRRKLIAFINRFRIEPWLLVSLMAATVLLVLTLLQTIYTVWGFYNQY